ncbi:hypothetical protein [Elizabethkingia sp. M8]|uniref:hypothetical protein n=1 Tax=Elizabethkingia sp. M8 TaxID=2796140 RepID=UPI001F3DC18B|nr:hypothetical protein [Elizabethkingia sp. M8]
MKKILSLATLFFSLLIFSQNITISQFKKVDSTNIKSLLNYLSYRKKTNFR